MGHGSDLSGRTLAEAVYRIFRPQGLSADASYRISPTNSATPPSTPTPSLRSGGYIDATRGHIVLGRNRRACMYALPFLSPSDVLVLTTWCCRDEDYRGAARADACFSRCPHARSALPSPLAPDAEPTLTITSSRAACSLQSSHSLPRALPPPPSYRAASHVVLPLDHCPVFTTSRFRSRSLRISPLAFAPAGARRSRLPTAISSASAPCTLSLAATPPVEIGDDHDVWRGGSLLRREACTPGCEREVKRCALAFRAPASSEGLLQEELLACETGASGVMRCRSRGAGPSRSPRTPTGRSREGDTDARLLSSSPRRARGWMEGAPEEGVGTLALRDRGDRSVIGSGTGNGNGNADDATMAPQRRRWLAWRIRSTNPRLSCS
ncbi:hypothetical protein B0H10DRAFT_2442190 [Mycena sp. CBHHK59/15]|nr:hypothetical protein B0H10DRAFT_2442190 [Mycena sp. CBHHK59/15]